MNLFGTCDLRTWELRVQDPGLAQSILMSCAALPAHEASQHYWPALSHIPLPLILVHYCAAGGQFSLDH